MVSSVDFPLSGSPYNTVTVHVQYLQIAKNTSDAFIDVTPFEHVFKKSLEKIPWIFISHFGLKRLHYPKIVK